MNFEISTIIRFHDFRYTETLKDALLSLAGQQDVIVTPIIVCQNFNQDDIAQLRRDILGYTELFSNSIFIEAVKVDGADGRSALLNRGIQLAKTRFVAILDCDDVLYYDAYKLLCTKMEESKAAIAFGAITWAECDLINGQAYISQKDHQKLGGTKYDLFIDNFCPIHSFVVDREQIAKDDLWFNNEMTMLEDYHFLLRIVTKYPSDFTCTRRLVGEYRRRTNDTIRDAANTFDVGVTQLEKSRQIINSLKMELRVQSPIIEFSKLANHWCNNPVIGAISDNENQRSDYIRASKNLKRMKADGAALLKFLRTVPMMDWKNGGIDTIVRDQDSDQIQISGWVCGDNGEEFSDVILCVGEKGSFHIGKPTFAREDLISSGFPKNSGFKVIVPNDNNYGLYVITNAGAIKSLRVFSGASISL